MSPTCFCTILREFARTKEYKFNMLIQVLHRQIRHLCALRLDEICADNKDGDMLVYTLRTEYKQLRPCA